MNVPQPVGFRHLPIPLLNPVCSADSVAVFWTRIYWMIPGPHVVFLVFLLVSRFGGVVLLAAVVGAIGMEAWYLFRLRHKPLTVSSTGSVGFRSSWERVSIDDAEGATFYWNRVFGNFAVSRLVIVDVSASPPRTYRVSGFGVWWPHIAEFSRDLERYGLTEAHL